MKPPSRSSPSWLVRWGSLLIGALLGGIGLVSASGELQAAREQVDQLQAEVSQYKTKIDREGALQAEVTRLEGEIDNLLRTPVTDEGVPAVIASTVTELGWRDLLLNPTPATANPETQSGVRRTSFSAQWRSSWEDLLRGVAALRERGIFVRNLSVNLDQDGTLRCEAALVHLTRPQR